MAVGKTQTACISKIPDKAIPMNCSSVIVLMHSPYLLMAQNFIIGKMFTSGQKMLEAINKKSSMHFKGTKSCSVNVYSRESARYVRWCSLKE